VQKQESRKIKITYIEDIPENIDLEDILIQVTKELKIRAEIHRVTRDHYIVKIGDRRIGIEKTENRIIIYS